jgi:hypothetical protein
MEVSDKRDFSAVAEYDALDAKIDYVREMLKKLADECELKTNIEEYNILPELEIPSRKANKSIRQSNLLVTFDPTETQLAYVMSCMRSNPVMSTLLTYSDIDDDMITIIGTQPAIIFEPQPKAQSRIFPIKPNLDKDDPRTVQMTKKALRYPFAA